MPKRVDANQPAIVKALRRVGASVTPTHMIGHGFVDLVVGFNNQNFLLEVKNDELPPSKRKLTPDEERWHAEWQGQKAVVSNENEALQAIGAI